MITIPKITGTHNGREYSQPERELTVEEKPTVIAQWGNADNYWYFQTQDAINNTIEWQAYQEAISPALTLAQAKINKCAEIDLKTQSLIFGGFLSDGKDFSLSITAQINWSNIPLLPDSMFPIALMTKNDELHILTLENRTAFYLSAVNGKNTHLQSGGALKIQVNALTTIADVQNFADPR